MWSRHLFIVAFVFGVGTTLQLFVPDGAWTRHQRLIGDVATRTAANARAEQRVQQLRGRVAALRNRAEVQESVIRDELGYVRPGDWVLELRP